MLALLALLAQQPADDGAVIIRLGGSVLPASAAGAAPALPPGPRVSLEFQEADIHSVLRFLSTVSGVNIVAGDDVKGTVTVRLVDVPYADALTVILASKGLGYTLLGSVVTVGAR
jgi:type IV pilus assembly protein PilQ